MSILVSVGAYKKHAAAEPDGASPWHNGEPPDVKCGLCQEDITEEEFTSGNVEWPPCGHFGHKQCPGYDGGLGYENLPKCPLCKKSLGHSAIPVVQDPEQMAAFEAGERRRYMERVATDIQRARSDETFWNSITADERVHLWNHILEHNLDPLPYPTPEEYEYESEVEPDLIEATFSGQVEEVRQILDDGAMIDVRGTDGWTALIYASGGGHLKVTHLLLERGAQVDLRDANGDTALMFASECDRLELVRLLLDRGAQVDLRDANGDTALMLASASGHLEVSHLLLERGAQVDLHDANGDTALMFASECDRLELVRLLLDRGAQVDLRNLNGDTALTFASRNDYEIALEIQNLLKSRYVFY